jgi:hypothetical protein
MELGEQNTGADHKNISETAQNRIKRNDIVNTALPYRLDVAEVYLEFGQLFLDTVSRMFRSVS